MDTDMETMVFSSKFSVISLYIKNNFLKHILKGKENDLLFFIALF